MSDRQRLTITYGELILTTVLRRIVNIANIVSNVVGSTTVDVPVGVIRE